MTITVRLPVATLTETDPDDELDGWAPVTPVTP